jgi:hypothetical protein
MTDAEYRAADGLNYTDLKAIDLSPFHFRDVRDNKREDTTTFFKGRAIHAATLEARLFKREYIVMPEGMKKGNSKVYKEFCAEHEGSPIITIQESELYQHIARKVWDNEHARKLLKSKGTEFEVPLFWEYRGHKLKSKLDWRNNKARRRPHMGDLKSTVTIDPHKFFRVATNYHYPAQFWYYQKANEFHTGERLPFYCIAVENVRPYDVAVIHCPDPVLDYGKEQIDLWLDRVEECEAAKHWPGVANDEILTFELPAWASPDDDLVIG